MQNLRVYCRHDLSNFLVLINYNNNAPTAMKFFKELG